MRLRLDVHSDNLEACPCIAHSCAACAAEEIEKTRTASSQSSSHVTSRIVGEPSVSHLSYARCLLDQRNGVQEVEGSNPFAPTTFHSQKRKLSPLSLRRILVL